MIIKNENKNMLVDFTSNQLTFLDTRFYRTDEGELQFFPSVTTILEAYPKSAQFYEWLKKMGDDADEIRDEAGRKGSAVHDLTERFDNGEEICLFNEHGYINYKLIEWSMFEKYVEFRRKFATTVIHNELNIVSPKYGMGGTLDRVMQVEDLLLLVDIKTSNAVHDHYWLQLAAYKKLLEEKQPQLKLDGVAILWLNSKTKTCGKKGDIQGQGWKLYVETDEIQIEKYWHLFTSCHQLWKATNEGAKPRQVFYSITHKY